jgi:hypothetical protein
MRHKYGKYAVAKTVVVIGGTEIVIVDARTGQEL